jgi:hypothetical protein
MEMESHLQEEDSALYRKGTWEREWLPASVTVLLEQQCGG